MKREEPCDGGWVSEPTQKQRSAESTTLQVWGDRHSGDRRIKGVLCVHHAQGLRRPGEVHHRKPCLRAGRCRAAAAATKNVSSLGAVPASPDLASPHPHHAQACPPARATWTCPRWTPPPAAPSPPWCGPGAPPSWRRQSAAARARRSRASSSSSRRVRGGGGGGGRAWMRLGDVI